MATQQDFSKLVRAERFTRLVAAYNAAVRWELHNSRRLFENKLVLLGAWLDFDGLWHLDSPPAAGGTQPY